MRILGIDFGLKRIGVAFTEGFLPSPLTVIEVRSRKQALLDIKELCERLGIEKIIIGESGGTVDVKARAFGEELSKQTQIPTEFIDETLTSKEAIKKLIEGKTTKKKRREMEDAVAAAIILNTYLENQP